MVVLRLENCVVPSRLSKWQWVNLFEEDGYEKIRRALKNRSNALKIPTLLVNSKGVIEPDMVLVPRGDFMMGSTIEQAYKAVVDGEDEHWVAWEIPIHNVYLSSYYIGKYLITKNIIYI